jgi:hypothetical protein
MPSWATVTDRREFHVAVDDKSAQSGDLSEILNEAREQRRLHPNDTIIIDLPSSIRLRTTIVLSECDSGSMQEAPLILRGPRNGARISGARAIDVHSSIGEGSENETIISIPAQSMGFSFNDKTWRRSSFSGTAPFPQIFQGERRLTMARWPATGFYLTPKIGSDIDGNSIAIRLDKEGYASIGNGRDVWLAGFWKNDWLYEIRRVRAVNTDAKHIVVEGVVETIPSMGHARIFALNIPDLREKGACRYDFEKKILNCHPFQIGDSIEIASLENLLTINGAKHLRIENVHFEKAYGTAVRINDASDIVLDGIFIGHSGAGISIQGGQDVVLENATITDLSEIGVQVGGGDRATLSRANHIIRYSHISRFGLDLRSYRPGIIIDGVGVTVDHCEIFDAPHAGVVFKGNDHLIANSYFHDLVKDTGDAGAIYAGRDFTARGNKILSNTFDRIRDNVGRHDVFAIYLDDLQSGVDISQNKFSEVDYPIFINGGSDNKVHNNYFSLTGGAAIRLEASGLTWQKNSILDGPLARSLTQVPYTSASWKFRYPELATRSRTDMGHPSGNEFKYNVIHNGSIFKFNTEFDRKYFLYSQGREVSVSIPYSGK